MGPFYDREAGLLALARADLVCRPVDLLNPPGPRFVAERGRRTPPDMVKPRLPGEQAGLRAAVAIRVVRGPTDPATTRVRDGHPGVMPRAEPVEAQLDEGVAPPD